MKKALSSYILLCFLVTSIIGPNPVYAQDFRLPTPGVMVHLSPVFSPAILKGIKVHPDNPFRFDFILDKGDSTLANDRLKDESTKLIKYFLASLTIPEKDLWVNLSPYEKDRIVPESFGQTEMGRDLLAEDYMLKQITASLIYPEDEIGKKFWKRIYEEAQKKFGTTNIPVNTFNKVWIIPEKAVVYENAKAGTAYVVESKLKVMLEQDYLSLQKHEGTTVPVESKETNQIGSQIVREIVIPELTKEVNEGKNFAQLRQVYNSLILATWYKKKIKDSILSQVYANKNKVAGVNIDDPQEKEKIFQQYLKAFKKGVYNYIKEDINSVTKETMPRKYFSGGVNMLLKPDAALLVKSDPSFLGSQTNQNKFIVEENTQALRPPDFAMNANDGKKMVGSILLLEEFQRHAAQNDYEGVASVNALGALYLEMIKKGWRIPIEDLENEYRNIDRGPERESYKIAPAFGKVLESLYVEMVRRQMLKLEDLEERLGNTTSDFVKIPVNVALCRLYVDEIRSVRITLAVAENRIQEKEDSGPGVFYPNAGRLYLEMIKQGEMTLDELKGRLIGKNEHVRRLITFNLWPFYIEMIKKGIVTLKEIEDSHYNLVDTDDPVGQSKAITDLYVQMVRQRMMMLSDLENRHKMLTPGTCWEEMHDALTILYIDAVKRREMTIQALESRINNNSFLEIPIQNALESLYVDAVKERHMTLSDLENRLSNEKDPLIRSAISNALGPVYVNVVKQGFDTIQHLISRLNTVTISDNYKNPIIYALRVLSPEMVKQRQKVSLAVFENPVKKANAAYDPNHSKLWETDPEDEDVNVLGDIYLEMVKQGQNVPVHDLETLAKRPRGTMRQAVANALAALYVEKVNQKMLTIEDLETSILDNKNESIQQAIVTALGKLALKRFKQVDYDLEREKYSLWNRQRLPYQKTIIQEYFNSNDPQGFIEQLKREAQQIIEKPFDYTNERNLWLAFVGTRINAINLTWEQFKMRIDKLIEFDQKHPGYWKDLFNKSNGLRVLTVSAKESKIEDTRDVNSEVFSSHLQELQGIKKRGDSLTWLSEFPGDKKLSFQNIYWNFKRNEAIGLRRITEKDRFSTTYPPDEQIKRELLLNKKEFYSTVFRIVFNKFQGEHSERCLLLMRDLIVAEILSDDDFLRSLKSDQVAERINAFRNLYEDYKEHLPQSAIGVKVDHIKGLQQKFEELSFKAYAEISKVKQIKTNVSQGYTLVPQGFLSVFRGRAGIIDCSFDMDQDKGYAFTRALHEDTIYYFVYKGNELKGYVGLMKGVTDNGREVLVVDTVNSPSLDGEELLTNLFNGLNALAKKMGLSGVALPQDIGSSFNFANRKTLPTLSFFTKGTMVKVRPIHGKSWAYFTAMYGEDTYNSIEEGKFVLLKLSDHAMNARILNSQGNTDVGGIDLTPANMNLRTQNNGGEIKFHLDAALLRQLQNALGFVPVIINIQPVVNLRTFLGLTDAQIFPTAPE